MQEKICWTGIALAKLGDCDFRVKHGINNYLENRVLFDGNLISLFSDSGM